jgi:hypothetical protein
MPLARSLLVALALAFAVGFALPAVFHRFACELFALAGCSLSPYPSIIGFLSEHRSAWLAVAALYALAVVVVFRGQLLTAFSAMRVGLQVRLAAAALVAVICGLLFTILSE